MVVLDSVAHVNSIFFFIITQISEDDQFIFCGTTSGDIMKINLRTRLLSDCGPAKAKYSLVGQFIGSHYILNLSFQLLLIHVLPDTQVSCCINRSD